MDERAASLRWSGASDKRSYYRLFSGYVLALFATGIATVGLALFAFDLAGDDSGAVIGTALSIKMLAYIFVAPILTVLMERFPRRAFLVGLDLVRGVSLILLPFVTAIWQIYALVFLFAVASAAFGLVYLAVVPYLLGSEEDYTRSLARSRIASEVEGPLSPLMAAGLIVMVGATGIFAIAAGVFALSAVLVRSADLPRQTAPRSGTLWSKLTRGPRLFIAVPEFRAVIGFDIVVALATAMVMVNTVVIVQGMFDLERDASAIAFFAFGAGSILGAVVLPFALSLTTEKRLMTIGAGLLVAGLLMGVFQSTLAGLLVLWVVLGFGVVWVLTPVTYLIRRLAAPDDLQKLFVAQASIANGCLLVAYSMAGWLGATVGLPATFLCLGGLAGAATVVALRLWRGAAEARG